MELVLEIKYPDRSDPKKHTLDKGVYVLGNQSNSDKGTPIQVDGAFVKKDHALLQFTRAGWMITALQPQVRRSDRNNELLRVHEPMKFGPNSRFVIGNLEFQFLAYEKELEEAEAEEEAPSQSLNKLISDVHLEVTAETQLITRIEKPDRDDPKYQAQVEKIVVSKVDTGLREVLANSLHKLSAEAARRDLVYRVLGGEGVMQVDSALGITEIDVLEFGRVQDRMKSALKLDGSDEAYVEDLANINANYEVAFHSVSKAFNTNLLAKLLKKTLSQSIMDLMFGVGPLEYLQQNDEISEIMVVGAGKIFVELGGNLIETGLSFVDEKSAQTITSYIVGRVGKQINVQNPYEDARLRDGSRVNAVIAPIALDGTALTIRKFGKSALTVEQLLAFDALSEPMASFLMGCIVSKKNILVSGGTGTGKTTMVNWLATMIPPDERIVTVEDTAELRLGLPHVVRLEARPPSADGHGAISIRDLVKNALRMRPDRIVIGECRGGEAFDMLQAMNTGHEGSLTTLHANNPVETMSRMENLVLMADQGLPIDAIRYQISGAVDIVVQLTRYPNGKRKISEIAEIGGIDPITNRIEVNPVFQTLYDHNQRGAKGKFAYSGRTPEGIDEIIKAGFDPSLLSF